MVLYVNEEPLPLAALLRLARNTLARRIRSALTDAGYDDLPANGPYVISATSVAGVHLAAIIDQLGLSKQASGQLVDLLVVRGYLDRHVDADDRRRLIVSPTERGKDAARVIREAADGLEARVAAAVGAHEVEAARRTLACLATMGLDDA
jgi:DNA-binding MarR family transcriptional regulator